MNYKRIILWGLIITAIVLPYAGLFIVIKHFAKERLLIKNAEFVIVDKQKMALQMYDFKGNLTFSAPIACGRNLGNKKEKGDLRTPEGIFHVIGIEDASGWSHDFKDGNGMIDSAYGPWFIRLDTPGHKGIGIHGTHAPESLGTRATEGCIRLKNEDVVKLKEKVHVGMTVVITPSTDDVTADIAGNENEEEKKH